MEILGKLDEENRLPSVYVEGKQIAYSGKKNGRSARRNSI